MAVSNFYGMNLLVAHSPNTEGLQQFRGSEGAEHFNRQNLFVQDSRVAQVRARTFIRFLEQKLTPQEKNKSSLHFLLRQTLQLSNSEENKQLFGQISQAFFKQRGYLSRLFSRESWEGWTENRTALGKVASHLRDCIESHVQVDSFTKKLDEEIVRKANEEADALLKSLGHRDAATKRSFRIESKSSCATGLVGGILGSLITQHPFPLLMGLSQCFPRVRAQQKVGSEFQVNNYTQDAQQTPSITSFQDGNFVVTWESNLQDGSGFGMYGQIFNGTGSKIGNEFQINNYTQDNQHSSSVASFQNVNFVVTWQSNLQDGSGWGVYGQIFNETGTEIGNEFQVNTYTSSGQKYPSVTSIKSGDFVVTWQSLQDSDGDGIYGQIFDGAGSNLGSEFQVNNYTQYNQALPSVASLDSGGFVVAWASGNQDGSNWGVYCQIFNGTGTKIGSEFQANTFTTNVQNEPSVASLSNDNFVVTWMSLDQDGSNYGIYGQLFGENSFKIGNEFQVNTEIVNSQSFPSVASLSSDHFIVTWSSMDQDGSSWGVYGQLFEGSTSRIGNEFQVHTYTNNDQGRSSVASLQNNNFVMTWNSQGQDGSLHGVYGQIFHDNFTLSSSSSSTSTSQTTTTTTLPFVSTIPVTSNPLSSSANRVTTVTSVLTSDSVSKIVSPSSNRNNGLFWLGLLLGGAGGIACMGLTAYYFSKKRKEETSMPGQAELGTVEMPPIDASRTDSPGDPEYKKLSDIREEPSDSNYGNRPKKALLDPEYANRPKREKRSSEYANRPRRADRDSLYANVPDAESESSETDIVTGEY